MFALSTAAIRAYANPARALQRQEHPNVIAASELPIAQTATRHEFRCPHQVIDKGFGPLVI